jgi:hypothetical protein
MRLEVTKISTTIYLLEYMICLNLKLWIPPTEYTCVYQSYRSEIYAKF